MNDTLTGFERRLLTELRTVVAENAAPRKHTLRRLTAVAAGIALVSGALALGLGRDGPSPASAVVVRSDGSVAITGVDMENRGSLQADLIAAGVPARVVRMPPECRLDAVLSDDQSALSSSDLPVPSGFGFRVRPDLIPPGDLLLLSVTFDGDFPAELPPGATAVRTMSFGPAIVRAVPDCARPV